MTQFRLRLRYRKSSLNATYTNNNSSTTCVCVMLVHLDTNGKRLSGGGMDGHQEWALFRQGNRG